MVKTKSLAQLAEILRKASNHEKACLADHDRLRQESLDAALKAEQATQARKSAESTLLKAIR